MAGKAQKVGIGIVAGFAALVGIGALLPDDKAKAGEKPGASSPATAVPAAYVGDWLGADGTQLEVRSDGSADLRAEGVSVENVGLTLDEKEKRLAVKGLFAIGKEYRIDAPPARAAVLGEKMTLSGVVFERVTPFPERRTRRVRVRVRHR